MKVSFRPVCALQEMLGISLSFLEESRRTLYGDSRFGRDDTAPGVVDLNKALFSGFNSKIQDDGLSGKNQGE